MFPGWKLRPREPEFLLSAAQQEHTFPSVPFSHLVPTPPAGGLPLPWAPGGRPPSGVASTVTEAPVTTGKGRPTVGWPL